MPPTLNGLGVLLAALDWPLEHDPGEVRSRARDLLSRPPYADAEPGLLERGLRWLGEGVARLLQVLTDGIAATGAVGAWIVVGLGTIALALVVWRLTRGSTLDRRSPQVPAAVPTRSASSWADEASEHERAGRDRDAVRCWYAATVVGLVERGVVEDVPGRTVRELDAEVARTAPELATRVTRAGAWFEAVVYGQESVTPAALAAVQEAARLDDAVRPATGRGEEVRA